MYETPTTHPNFTYLFFCQCADSKHTRCLYPNPTNAILNIQAEGSISSIEIMNVLGQTLLTSKGNGNREQVDISGLSAGNYFVRVFVGESNKVLRVLKK